MRKHHIWAVLALTFACTSCWNRQPKTSCVYGDDIPQEAFEPMFNLSEQLVQYLEDEDYQNMYDLSTAESRNNQTRDQFSLVLDLFTRAFGSIEYPFVEEAYLMDSKSKDEEVWVPCNLGEPGVNDLWGMPANRRLGIMVYRARTDMELVRVVFQIELENGEWRLRSVGIYPTTLKHKTHEYYVKKALEFREKNLLHLAVLYYKTGILLSEMGLNANEFAVRVLTEQMNQIKVDYMPAGEVQLWSMDSGKTYKVYNLDPAYDNGNLLVQISYMTATLADRDNLATEAREMALFLDKKFPEYRQGFDGMRVTAASEKQEELLKAYHTVILFKDLPDPGLAVH